MTRLDIREVHDTVDDIVFAEENDVDNSPQAYRIFNSDSNYVGISDSMGEVVIINGKEHAQNLIKALNKAIELGWLK